MGLYVLGGKSDIKTNTYGTTKQDLELLVKKHCKEEGIDIRDIVVNFRTNTITGKYSSGTKKKKMETFSIEFTELKQVR